MGNPWEVALVIGWFAIWFLFPIGVFLSEAKLDKNSDEKFQWKRTHAFELVKRKSEIKPRLESGHHWSFSFRRGLRH